LSSIRGSGVSRIDSLQRQEEALAGVLRRELGLPESFFGRYQGPGFATRVPGEITRKKLEILPKADTISLNETRRAGLSDWLW
jgi:GMP synthase PP-ATPase subunit